MGELPRAVSFVVVGAGVAGAAAAYALARRGEGDILVLEAEPVAGAHASGRNAAMAYSFLTDEVNRRLALRGRAFIAGPPDDFPVALDNRWPGSLTAVLGPGDEWAAVATALRAEGVALSRWSGDEISARVPVVGPGFAEYGYFCPQDGVIDIHGLLQGYLRAARARGAILRTRLRAEALAIQGDRVTGVVTGRGAVAAGAVLLASGPWANELPGRAGLRPLPLSPCLRHLGLVAGLAGPPDPTWPFIWNQTHGFYFRPESGGLLVCACDEDEVPPGDVGPVEEGITRLAEKTLALLPGAAAGELRQVWAGLRTLTPDDRFVIGPDPRLPGLFWVAGLGGHGMTTSPAVGELTADLLLQGRCDWIDAAAMAPDRFL